MVKKKIWIVFLMAGLVICIYFLKEVVVWDHSAVCGGDVSIYWNDVHYIGTGGVYEEGGTLARTKDMKRRIDVVVGDDEHIFVVNRSFYENWLLVREDYEIPEDGIITIAYWNHQRITDEDFLTAVSKLSKSIPEEKTHETIYDQIYGLTEEKQLSDLWVGYDDCPVGTKHLGFLGKYNGKWIFADNYEEIRQSNGGFVKATFDYCYIPEELVSVFQTFMGDETHEDTQEEWIPLIRRGYRYQKMREESQTE